MSLPSKGKILALDLGSKRTGLAITDEDQTVAFPRPELEYQNIEELFAYLKDLVETEKVTGILVGLPLNMQGEDSEQTKWTRKIHEELMQRFNCPIQTIDERWSSVQAKIRMSESKHVDSESARILLEGLLK